MFEFRLNLQQDEANNGDWEGREDVKHELEIEFVQRTAGVMS